MFEKHEIKDRASWLKMRQQDVTASVAGALLGVHDYQTPLGLWALKTGTVTEDPEENPAMRRGRLFEPVAVEILREEHPELKAITRPGMYYRDPKLRIGATPDVLCANENGEQGVIQIKTVEKGVFRRKWQQDEDGIPIPPLWVAVQAIIEAKATGSTWAAVAPLVVSFGIELPVIPIPLHEGIWDRVVAETELFWKRVSGELPKPETDYGRDGALLAEMYAETDGTILDLSGDNELPEILAEQKRLAATKKGAEGRLDEIKAMLLTKMGTAAEATCQDWRIKYPTINRKAYEVKAGSYRRLTITPPRGFVADATATADTGEF